jgi:hypothetical protein
MLFTGPMIGGRSTANRLCGASTKSETATRRYDPEANEVSTRSVTTTGVGTSLSDVMKASDLSHAVVSTEPVIGESPVTPLPRHASIVA